MIRGMSNEGWRLQMPAPCRNGLEVGALVALPGTGPSLPLGIVRWLARGDGGIWEAGVEALNDHFSACLGANADGAPSALPVLIAGAQRLAERHAVVAILPGGWAGKIRMLRLHTPAIALELSCLIEAGQDFDIVAMRPAGHAGIE